MKIVYIFGAGASDLGDVFTNPRNNSNSEDTILIFSPSFNIKLNMTPQNSTTAAEFSKVFPEYPRKRDRINLRIVDTFVNPLHMSFPLEFGSQLLP